MLNLLNEQKCTGCMACVNVCPQDAIKIEIGKTGFEYPCIDKDKCIECNMCAEACKNAREIKLRCPIIVYAAWTKNEKIRLESSSGGVFSILAEYIIGRGGYVFGAAFNSNMVVEHICIHTPGAISKLRGSKYVQSSIGWCYRKIDELLKKRELVLFSGTPCQVAGLYAFLGRKDVENLYTVDLVCHGVPSPKVFEEYKRILEERFQSNMQEINFRDKKRGWFESSTRIVFENKAIYEKSNLNDPFIVGFLKNLYLRPSCYQCEFRNFERGSDITLGDFWGYKDTCKADLDDDKGISQVMVNSAKGCELFDAISNKLIYFERGFEETKNNLGFVENYEENPEKNLFWRDFETKDFAVIEKEYMPSTKKSKMYFLRKLALRTPYSLRVLKRKIIP